MSEPEVTSPPSLQQPSRAMLKPRASNFEFALNAFKPPTEKYGHIEPFDNGKSPEEDLSLEAIWCDEYLHVLLKAHACRKFAEENILFLEQVLAMKNEKDVGKIKPIYDEYIVSSSPMEINILAATKKRIQDAFSKQGADAEVDLSIFDEAIDELVKLIKESILQEFLVDYRANSKKVPRPLAPGRKRVVVIGGGFVGLTAGRLLDSMPRFEVTLIDTKEFFEYTPSIIRTMVDPCAAEKWQIPFKTVIQNGRLVVGSVDYLRKDFVVCGNERIPYDYLVLGTGSSYTSQFKGLNISTSYRLKKLEMEYEALRKAKKILVIGGGLVGVEISTEIANKFPDKKILLVEANNCLLKRTPEKARSMALQECKRLGIEVAFEERVTSFDFNKGEFCTSKGRNLSCDKVFLATGPVPNTGFLVENMSQILDDKKQIKVNNTLQVVGQDHIFSGGDVTNLPVEKLAYNAVVHGIAIARNICRMEKGKSPAEQGTKGIPKPKRIQVAQVINFGPQKAMVIYQESFTTISTAAAKYKDTFSMASLEMVIGKRDWVGVFGKIPTPLGLPDEDSKSDLNRSKSQKSNLSRRSSSSSHSNLSPSNSHNPLPAPPQAEFTYFSSEGGN